MMLEEDIIDEVIDGDEGIVNRRLPINTYNHQVSPRVPQSALRQHRVQNQARKMQRNFEEEEGIENCKEEDEERKEGDGQN